MQVVIGVVEKNVSSLFLMTRKERRDFLRQELRRCDSRVSRKGYLRTIYKIGDVSSHPSLPAHVCRQAFRYSWNMTRHYLETLAKELKGGISVTTRTFSDTSTVNDLDVSPQFLNTVCSAYGVSLTQLQRAAMKISNSPVQLCCYGWMEYYFKCVGDQEPNRDGEIHLDACNKEDIYKEYLEDMEYWSENAVPLDLSSFGVLWLRCFP